MESICIEMELSKKMELPPEERPLKEIIRELEDYLKYVGGK